jgi:hypothetical protein
VRSGSRSRRFVTPRLVPRLNSLLTLVVLAGCGAGAPLPVADADSGPDWFVDRARDVGIDFVHTNGMSGRFSMAEIMAPGVALFDYDNDGDLDVYLVQGGPLSPSRSPAASLAAPARFGDRLYRNDLANGVLRFTDVTAASGIESRGYGMGVATGDFDNDGRTDLYVTRFDAPNQLLRNNGDGTFSDVSKSSGTDHHSWSASAAFVDIDRDGWLDLYVTNYLRYSLADEAPCVNAAGARGYCRPEAFPPLSDRLFVNRRDGTFADVSGPAGILRESAPGLGVATVDFDRDGWMDIYVANDGRESHLWRNRRDGTFDNLALLSGVALPVTGRAEASMGVDAGDFDDDGDDDLVVTELTGEGTNLFVNDGTGVFEDRSAPSGLGPATMAFTGFGTAWIDADRDGRLDLIAVNGAVQIIEPLRQAGDPLPLHQRKLLFVNSGGGRFHESGHTAGGAFALSEVGRGLAVGDVDNDGVADVLVGNNHGPTRLLLNQSGRRHQGSGARVPHHWIGLSLTGQGGRHMLGARVEVVTKDGSRWRRARADGSYLSANDPRVLVPLGAVDVAPDVRVLWPGGRTETFRSVPIDRYSTLIEGQGR